MIPPALQPLFDDPRGLAALAVVLAVLLVAQRFLGWRRYAMLHRLRLVVFPLLDGREGLFLVSRKGDRDDDEYLGTVDKSVAETWKQLVSPDDGDGSPHLLSAVKVRRLADGTRQYAEAHAVWTHADGSQTESYLFAAPDGGTDVYAHNEPSVTTPRKHLTGAQTDGDPYGVVRAAFDADALTDRARPET